MNKSKNKIKYEFGEKYIVKDNLLIEAYHDPDMTLQEQRLMATALSKITPNMEVLDFIYFTPEEFCSIYELDKDSIYGKLEGFCKDLLKRILHIQVGVKDWNKFQWFSEAEYKDGIVKVKFHYRLKPYLLFCRENRAYTKYLYKNIFNFKNKYSLYFYELLKQYQTIGKRSIDIKNLRLHLGIKKSEYQRFSTLKLRVLAPAIKEINTFTDISVEITEVKEHQKTTIINFFISSSKNYITNFKKIPKENLITYIVKQYYNKTGYVIKYNSFIGVHRIILLDLVEIVDRGVFANIKDHNAYMTWQIQESINKFDAVRLKEIIDF